MPGALADLSVAARLALRAAGRRLRGRTEPAEDLDQFQTSLSAALQQAPAGLIKQHLWLDMPASQPPWMDTGLKLEAGDAVSWFAAGRITANGALDLYFSPALQVWCRVGAAGPVFRGTRSNHSFVATQTGTLQFGNYFPNSWKNRGGERLQDDGAYANNQGGFRILIIHWASEPSEGLARWAETSTHPQLADELSRLEQGNTVPPGWQYLWHVGPAEIFQQQGETCIHCHTRRDVGILQKDLDLPLTPDTALHWRWRVNALPSTLREDTVPSHDYLSIAVEFDNGRDITYYWSASLPEGFGYDCPLPNWQGIEYHVVVRSGPRGLGTWQDETRNLYRDYRHYMGEPPARITRVWFIAVSIFQRREGDCEYADISLTGPGGERTLVL